jgi:cell division protein FtsL
VLEKEVKIQELSEKNGELEAKVAEVAAEVETLKETISAKEAEIEEVKNSVADKTIEALASIGQSEPLDLDNKGEQKTVLETFESLKGADATAFYKANRKAILAEQSKK